MSDNTPALITCATTSQPTKKTVRCEAQGCIRNKLPMHLSSTGYFLSASLIITCSRQSLLSASIKGIIDAGYGICQGVSKKIVASGLIYDMMFL